MGPVPTPGVLPGSVLATLGAWQPGKNHRFHFSSASRSSQQTPRPDRPEAASHSHTAPSAVLLPPRLPSLHLQYPTTPGTLQAALSPRLPNPTCSLVLRVGEWRGPSIPKDETQSYLWSKHRVAGPGWPPQGWRPLICIPDGHTHR